ncbi:MAG: sulfurtransferase [Zavarzinella sp.]
MNSLQKLVGYLAFATLWIVSPSVVRADPYPADLLVEVSDLSADSAKSWIILDARPKPDYEKGHIPGARWVDHATWAKTFGDGEDLKGWAAKLGDLGISAKDTIVVYDNSFSKDAARIWWIVRYWGVENAKLLNGGWAAYEGNKGPTSIVPVFVKKTTFVPKADQSVLATKEELMKSLKTQSLQIVDSRSEKEHCGLDPLKNKRAGAIPSAKLLEWKDLLDPNTQKFKPKAELQKLFEVAGIDLQRPTVTHCQSGGRAAVMAFGMELMGGKNVKNYYRSWAEWSADPTAPVVKPPQPKK